jgi:hypothetical protein
MEIKLLDLPNRIAPSAWIEHTPFAMAIMRMHEPITMAELGVHNGVSYCAFCDAVKKYSLRTRCFGIDTWKGDAQAGFYDENVYEDLRGFHDQNYSEFSTLIRASFDHALKMVFADEALDLLHIDGFHTYEAIDHDFESWIPKMSHKGIILMHDTAERQPGFGVWKKIAELRNRYPVFEFFHEHGLGVVFVGKDSCNGDAGDLLLKGDGDFIRDLFFTLGRRVKSWSTSY